VIIPLLQMIFVLLSLMAIATQANNFTYENDVMILDESNFDEALDQFEYIFLDFYAPWCDHW
jgi:protein disulfide-isomerase A1